MVEYSRPFQAQSPAYQKAATSQNVQHMVTTTANGQPVGSILGATTGGSTANNTNDSNAGKQGYYKNEFGQWVPEGGGPGAPDYSAYFDDLNRQIDELGGQRAGQEQIAQNTYDQGMNTLNSQLTQGKAEVEANQQKTLRDLSTNMRQSWQQGNAMLGTRGASDSSAANQYAFALTKFGNQQRGDVQSQYQGQLFKLQNVYDTESKNLELAKNSQLQQIAQWFADAQNQLKSAVGQGKLQASQQAYQTALQMMQQAQQESSSRRQALDQWALSRATSYGEAAKAMGIYGSTQAATPSMNGLFGNQPQQQNRGASAGYGYNQQKYDQFGNPIQ